MKLLVATNNTGLFEAIKTEFDSSKHPMHVERVELFIVKTIDELITAMKSKFYDFLVTDYWVDGTDIWRLATLISSHELAKYALPIYLLQESCYTDIPSIMSKQANIHVVNLGQLSHTLIGALNFNRQQGFGPGHRVLAKPSVLIIEDDQNAADLINFNLKNEFAIDIAGTGSEGLALWKQAHHELVLLDFILPDIHGDQVLAQLLALDKNQPVIVMTAYDTEDRFKALMLDGARNYLAKPLDISRLRATCFDVLNQAKLIYQDHYYHSKQKLLMFLVLEIEKHLARDELEVVKKLVRKIRTLLPGEPTEDELSAFFDKGILK